jgi:hypothetical protein
MIEIDEKEFELLKEKVDSSISALNRGFSAQAISNLNDLKKAFNLIESKKWTSRE